MLWCALLLAVVVSAQGRAVNISNTWVLPEEGFPVFYRYFRDRISWYEADAVCQFHHANLVTVDTTSQYDAVRAYLKELDITSAVWVGLIRSNPDGDFTWTDYRGLSSDGYWSSAPDARSAPLCAAADPAADYRWEAKACGGPTVASFICELPVPQWALGNEGCMVRALPALTILYLPESAAVQLTADCGLAGVKRVQCTGNVKREILLRDLSCSEEEEVINSSSPSSVSNTWLLTTESIFSVQDTTREITTEESNTTNLDDDNIQSMTSSSTSYNINTVKEYKSPIHVINNNKLNRLVVKDLDLSNNLQSNFIPKLAPDNHLSNEELDKIEHEKHMQHKMLHEEIARLGNLENIFTQPTDHFVPPLVMAKAKISNDMIVLSLQEKHAQEFSADYLNNSKHSNDNHQVNITHNINVNTTTEEVTTTTSEKSLVVSIPTLKLKDNLKREKIKSPKKYNVKLDDPKSKIMKLIEPKSLLYEKTTDLSLARSESTVKETATTPMPILKISGRFDDEPAMDLTVLLMDSPIAHENNILFNYSGDVSKLEVIKNSKFSNDTEVKLLDIGATEEIIQMTPKHIEISDYWLPTSTSNKVIKMVSEDPTDVTPTIFEITTKVSTTEVAGVTTISNKNPSSETTPHSSTEVTQNNSVTTPLTKFYTNLTAIGIVNNSTTELFTTYTTEKSPITKEMIITTTIQQNMMNTASNQTDNNVTKDSIASVSVHNATTKETMEEISTENHEDYEINTNSSETIDDFQSPLLSAANEPLHRPNRSRRPQPPPNRNKFNPFRILG